MDVHRAKDIIASKEFIPVEYEGTPVYINRVFESSPYAEVRYENGAVTEVPVSELKEVGKPH
ncbi:hypothetical protein Alches_14590 [Alicyclobacillus hesperidum subsp. aegles]|uniref:Small acid-soluble spore protein H (Minor) n=1 Tax=Alicyclobacillus hesperidum TaxID=89784 RepID=A0AA37X162_9BACL|nr:H-type small acid-soluble spore protein [Alicyclobacillus hesperidum]KRW92916.1 hypothetical protein SD51_01195 [Alicyclobacillus tengchongensis]GLG01420.1 hypothetical protein Alches_14590 [Alicyclobacillus hesperidum subsp. aegles]GLV12666.1 hypothetical protein Heshes_03500 [Alicyclobacillus hesperidum]